MRIVAFDQSLRILWGSEAYARKPDLLLVFRRDFSHISRYHRLSPQGYGRRMWFACASLAASSKPYGCPAPLF
jgi:hypothetical protein